VPPHRFDRFTERARKVLQLAQEEAHRLNHNYIGTEHLLLGLVREGEGVAARVLANLGVTLSSVRSGVEFITGRGDRTVIGDIGLTPRAKRVIELSNDEARRLNHHYIGTEHLLLGLVREGEGIAAGVLESLGVELDEVRSKVIYVLNQSATYGSARPAARGLGGSAEIARLMRQEMGPVLAKLAGWTQALGAGAAKGEPLSETCLEVQAAAASLAALLQRMEELASASKEESGSPPESEEGG
jgi:ATP-dependent Clp protease ATP-binding subunit ClpA